MNKIMRVDPYVDITLIPDKYKAVYLDWTYGTPMKELCAKYDRGYSTIREHIGKAKRKAKIKSSKMLDERGFSEEFKEIDICPSVTCCHPLAVLLHTKKLAVIARAISEDLK